MESDLWCFLLRELKNTLTSTYLTDILFMCEHFGQVVALGDFLRDCARGQQVRYFNLDVHLCIRDYMDNEDELVMLPWQRLSLSSCTSLVSLTLIGFVNDDGNSAPMRSFLDLFSSTRVSNPKTITLVTSRASGSTEGLVAGVNTLNWTRLRRILANCVCMKALALNFQLIEMVWGKLDGDLFFDTVQTLVKAELAQWHEKDILSMDCSFD